MSVVRWKYRPPAIQPELKHGKKNTSLSVAKKERPPEVDPYESMYKVQNHEIVYLASHTQVKRIELAVKSDEEAYRREHYPTIQERVEIQKNWAIKQMNEAKLEAKKLALKRSIDQQSKHLESEDITEEETGPNNGDFDIEKEIENLNNEDEDFDENIQSNDPSKTEMLHQFLEIKERKIIATRNTLQYHKSYSKWERRKLAIATVLGWIRGNNKDLSYIMPWLLLGRKDVATSIQGLLRLNVSHILNVTHDTPNLFNRNFMYLKIPIKDSTDSDIGKYFASIAEYIKRCEECKGRILVHCSAGASRAPSAVIAFLVLVKKIPLVDAYNLVYTLRPLMQPNRKFLFQLAMLEVQLGLGCSVYYHREWRFYEFNVFRAEQVPDRPSLGLYKTIIKLYSPDIDISDLDEDPDN